jgi:hypothetical protein
LITVLAIENNLCAFARDLFSQRCKGETDKVEEIPELLKFGAFAGEMRLFTLVGPQTSLKTEGFVSDQADGSQLFCGKVFYFPLRMEVI